MSLCIKCSTVIRSFYLPHESDPYLSPNRTVSVMRRLTKGRIITKQGQDESYSFSSSVECKLCIMMATEISPRLLDCGQALISFSGSRSILKGWINSEPAFSFHVHIEDMEYDDHDTKKLENNIMLGSGEAESQLLDDLNENNAITTTGYLRDADRTRVNLARTWIHDCHTMHTSCNSSTYSYSPTRLVDVQQERLIETCQQPGPFQYAAFTYCWGPNMPESAMTKKHTLLSNMKSINFSELPNSLRDVLVITRTLNIAYIWIDSLCIVQDSREDWEKVSAQMGLVYSHAWCTIAASSAKSCHDGIQLCRVRQLDSCDMILNENQGSRVRVTISQSPPTWKKFYDSNPLNKRGWTFQERELSPRILHFSTDQIWWECRSIRAQEDTPLEDDKITEPKTSLQRKEERRVTLDDMIILEGECANLAHTRYKRDQDITIFSGMRVNPIVQLRCLDNMLTDSKLLPNPTIYQNIVLTEARYNTWHFAIQDYSARTFTKITDRFPAISGLASEMQAIQGGEYVAGLWREDLLRSLIWRRDQKAMHSVWRYKLPRRPSEYRAPSWSWAAIDEAISYDLVTTSRLKIDGLRPTTAHIENVSIVPAGSDPKGRLKSGSLLIQGKVKLYSPSPSSRRSMIFHFDFCDEDEDIPVYLLSLFEAVSMVHQTVSTGPYVETEYLEAEYNSFGTLEADLKVLALALIMIEDPVPVFRRVGVVSGIPPEWFSDAMDVKISIV